MHRFVFQVVIEAGDDEFWEDVMRDREQIKIPLVRQEIEDCLAERGYDDSTGTVVTFVRMDYPSR